MSRRSRSYVVLSLTLAIMLGGAALPGVASAFTLLEWLVVVESAPTHSRPGVVRTLPFRNAYTLGATSGAEANDYYRVHLLATQILVVSVRGTSGTGSTHLYLQNAGGALVWSGAMGGKVNRMTYTTIVEGDYDISVENDTGGATTMDYVVAASIYDPAGNDVSSAVSKTLPFNEQDFVDAVAYPEMPDADMDDVFSVWLSAGTPFVASLTGGMGSDHDLYLYKPGSPTVKTGYADPTIAVSSRNAGTSTEGFTYTPTVSGTYYLDVSARPGTAGRYNLSAALGKVPTSITLGTNKTSVVKPKPFELSGVLTGGSVGELVISWVKKPGKAYWSYSSNRLCYAAAAGGAKWWYRYTPVGTKSPKGTYYFKTSYPGSATKDACVSPTITVKVK
jgi:hypothetical protein